MLDTIAQNLVPAITVAISPMPLIALIVLMLVGTRTAAITWTIAWYVTVAVLIGVATLTGSTAVGEVADDTGVNYVAFVIAALFLWFGWQSLRDRPAPGVQAEEPGWLATLGEMSPPKVAGLSVAIMLVNAKNLPLYIAMGASVGAADLSSGAAVSVVLILALVSSITAIVILLVAILGGQRATELLHGWRAWLVQNNKVVMGLLFVILGISQLGTALQSL